MSVLSSEKDDSDWLDELVARLIQEHRVFSKKIGELRTKLSSSESPHELSGDYNDLRDDLVEHMLVEEHDFYPELIRRDKFDEFVSGVMQQHHEITAALGKMELAIRINNSSEFRRTLDQLTDVLGIHQPAEEEKVFPLVSK